MNVSVEYFSRDGDAVMTRHNKFISSFFSMIGILFSCFIGFQVKADSIAENFRGLKLNADLRLAPGKSIKDGVSLMIPAALSHHRMEIIISVQDVLAELGFNTLAITPSLGYDNRRWYFDCEKVIQHTNNFLFDEIDFWVDWLRNKGVMKINLIGHSVSANYISMYMDRRNREEISTVVLLAPATRLYGQIGIDRYETRFKISLSEVLARADQYIAAGKGASPMPEATDYFRCPQAKVTPDAFLSLYRDEMSQNFPNIWSSMPRPLMIVLGTSDNSYPVSLKEVKRIMRNNGLSLKIVSVENGGHHFKGLYTETIVKAMAEFFSENR